MQPPVTLERRHCSSCGVEDVVQQVHGEYDAAGQPKFEHLVTIELRYLKAEADCSQRYKARGWTTRPNKDGPALIHQGRPAMQRFICRPCMVGHMEMEKEFQRKKQKEIRASTQGPNYYMALCGE